MLIMTYKKKKKKTNAIKTESITGRISVLLVASLNKTPGPPFTHFFVRNLKAICHSLFLSQCRSKGNISGGAHERRRREPLGGSGGMLPKKFWNLEAWKCCLSFLRGKRRLHRQVVFWKLSQQLLDNILFSTFYTGLFLLFRKKTEGARPPPAPSLATALVTTDEKRVFIQIQN